MALPPDLVEDARRVAPAELRDNFNMLVREALAGYIVQRRRQQFAQEMERMARDPQILRESGALTEEFESTLADGLA